MKYILFIALFFLGCSKPNNGKVIVYASARGAYYSSSSKTYYAGPNKAYILDNNLTAK